jgi:O-acetylhomoserine/O-acetylserine sulfhydrylase-like pyridoxal-dependent enzyme
MPNFDLNALRLHAIRLSVGLGSIADILADIDQPLAQT